MRHPLFSLLWEISPRSGIVSPEVNSNQSYSSRLAHSPPFLAQASSHNAPLSPITRAVSSGFVSHAASGEGAAAMPTISALASHSTGAPSSVRAGRTPLLGVSRLRASWLPPPLQPPAVGLYLRCQGEFLGIWDPQNRDTRKNYPRNSVLGWLIITLLWGWGVFISGHNIYTYHIYTYRG